HEESDQFLQLCQEAAEAHRDMNDIEGAETIFSALLGFLRSQGWRDQVSEAERMMRETLGSAAGPRRRRTANASRSVIPQRPRGGGWGVDPMPGGGNQGIGMGLEALVGGRAASPGGQVGMPGDHLAQLIDGLRGGGHPRASLMALPEPVRAQV